MNLRNSENKEDIQLIEEQIWNLFEVLRGALGVNDRYVVLLYLSLYKDNLINKDFLYSQNPNDPVFRVGQIADADYELVSVYNELIRCFQTSILQIRNRQFHDFIEVLFAIDSELLTKNFADIFDSILYKLAQATGRLGGEGIQPYELSKLIDGLHPIKNNHRIFNPFAGFASFGVTPKANFHYFGQEINNRNWAIGKLRLLANSKAMDSIFRNEDSITNWPQNERFDLIIANPPYGMRMPRSHRDQFHNFHTIEQFIIWNGLESLHHDGRLIIVIPNRFLFSSSSRDKDLKRHLIESGKIETIISLPPGILLNTGISVSVLVIRHQNFSNSSVKFVDGRKYATKKSKTLILDYVKLIADIVEGSDTDVVRTIGNQEIINNDYVLSVPRYFQKHIEGVRLGDILEVQRGSRQDIPEKGRLVRIRDLSNDKLNFKLDVDNIEEANIKPSQFKKIDFSCLLLATYWKTLKPTWFEFSNKEIYLRPDILTCTLKRDDIDIAYLANELAAEYVTEQIDSYRIGAVHSRIRRDDLLNVVIKLPSLSEQRAKVEGISELSHQIEALRKERNALAHGVESTIYRTNSSIKHALGKPLLNMGSSIRNIENALSKSSPDWQSLPISEKHGITLKDTFDSLHRNMELIHKILKSGDSEIDFNEFPKSSIDFLKYIKNYVRMTKANVGKNINVNLDIHPNIKEELKNKAWIISNQKLLDIALNVLTENADQHAFTNHLSKYTLEFRISLSIIEPDSFLKIEVSNDGNPFPENYRIEKFVTNGSKAGETANTGQGGFQLNEIIKYHNEGKSTLDLIKEERTHHSLFSTTFSFLIPLNNEA